MKIFLLNFFLFILISIKTSFSYANEEVYFCIADDSNGFNQVKKGKFEIKNFEPERYTVKINFEKAYIESEDLMIISSLEGHDCDYTPYTTSDIQIEIMSCYNNFGNSFAINKINLNFIHSYGVGFLVDIESNLDDINISYGTCQKF